MAHDIQAVAAQACGPIAVIFVRYWRPPVRRLAHAQAKSVGQGDERDEFAQLIVRPQVAVF